VSILVSRARRSAVVALVAGLLLAMFLTTGRSPQPRLEARSVGFSPTTGAVFNRPVGSRSEQTRIFTYLNKTIDATPRGATIRFAVFSFAWKPTADALLRAHHRGVHVQLVFDGHKVYSQETRLRRALGSNPRHASFVTLCKGTCRGASGDMHDKVFLFSQAGSAGNVVMVGSDNLTAHNARDQWSDLYSVVGEAPLYWMYAGMFDQLKYDRRLASPYIGATVDGYGVQIYPRPGTTQATDPLAQILSKIDCNQPAADGTQVTDAEGNPVVTEVRLSQHAWNGDRGRYLAQQIGGLQRQGCKVSVIYGVGIGSAVRSILQNAGVAMNGGQVRGVRTHQKVLMVSGIYDGDPNARIVWTGSHNWSDGALRRDDNVFEVSGDAAYQQYLANFNDIWTNG
jgi:phosphatidylserine/phosphatidylglycerophosphate/cardiolipin synthase-like enzyme